MLTHAPDPKILKYARKNSGFTIEEVAKKAGVKVDILLKAEKEKIDFSIARLEKLAEIYKRTLAYFLLHKIPEDITLPDNFRIVYKDGYKLDFSPKIYLIARKARYIQSVISSIKEKIKYDFPVKNINDNAEEIGIWFREYLGIDAKTQFSWKNSNEALREWKNKIEEKNIFVLQDSLKDEDVSAFCFVDQNPYIIVLNSSEHEYRRIFSLFHEIGHILIRKSGICNPYDLSGNSYEYIKIEKFCNQFSASFLLPKKVFLNNDTVKELHLKSFNEWEDFEIIKISNKFKVSKEVVLRRFLTFDYITEKQYEEKRGIWKKENDNYKPNKNKEIKIPYFRKVISQNGKGYTSLVVNEYHLNKISFTTVADYLSINSRHIPRVIANL